MAKENEPVKITTDDTKCQFDCSRCEFSTAKYTELKSHIQTIHQSSKVNMKNVSDMTLTCEDCEYVCRYNIQMKKHQEKKHKEGKYRYGCDICDYRDNFLGNVWKHKLAKHSDMFHFNSSEENIPKDILLNLVAEQNANLMEEVVSLKKNVKEVIMQVTYDFEDIIEKMRKTAEEQHLETKATLSNISKRLERAKPKPIEKPKQSKKPASSSPSSSTSSKSSKKTPSSASPQTKIPHNKKSKVPQVNQKKKSEYQCKPRVLLVGDSLLHNTHFRYVEDVTNTTIKTSKAYSSVWNEAARFKELNIQKVTKNELKKSSFQHLVLSAPTMDISNLDTTRVTASDNVDRFKQQVISSCQNMINIAQDALAKHPELKKVTIMNHTPRFDTPDVDPVGLKHNLANFANSCLLELWMDCTMKDKIFIGSHNLESSGAQKTHRYTDERSRKYDGVHLYGNAGKAAYTESVLNILMAAFQTQAPAQSSQAKQNSDDSHASCPQSKYRKQKRKYSSVVSGQSSIKTQNRFSPLGGFSGNA